MIYATLREALYDFFTHNAPLVSDGGYYSSEDVFTALPYAKGRRYFDAVALLLFADNNFISAILLFLHYKPWLSQALCEPKVSMLHQF